MTNKKESFIALQVFDKIKDGRKDFKILYIRPESVACVTEETGPDRTFSTKITTTWGYNYYVFESVMRVLNMVEEGLG